MLRNILKWDVFNVLDLKESQLFAEMYRFYIGVFIPNTLSHCQCDGDRQESRGC